MGMVVSNERTHNLVLRVSDDELAMLRTLADERGVAMAVVVRDWIRNTYRDKHGDKKPKAKR